MLRYHCKHTSTVKDQANISSLKPTSPIDLFAKDNCLDKL